jgi:Fur family ferric uptake transcriptional regulator
MQQSVQIICNNLKTKKYRLTIARKALIECFCSNSNPLTVQGIITMLKKDIPTLNKSTVYRELGFLEKLNIIQKVYLAKNAISYELVSENHYHHVSCLKCQEVTNLKLDKGICQLNQQICKQNGYKAISHSIEFFGICSKCQNKTNGGLNV